MRLLRILPRAEADTDEAADYHADHGSLEVGLRFLGAVKEAYDFICQNPEVGTRSLHRNRGLEGLRRWRVPGFENYLVFYRLVDDWVEIVRVLHGARDIDALLEAEG